MGRIKLGSRVSTEAWCFSNKHTVTEEHWSFLTFGEKWLDSRVIGTVEGKSENRWVVRWDMDQDGSSWETEFLFKEDDSVPMQKSLMEINTRKPGNSFLLL